MGSNMPDVIKCIKSQVHIRYTCRSCELNPFFLKSGLLLLITGVLVSHQITVDPI